MTRIRVNITAEEYGEYNTLPYNDARQLFLDRHDKHNWENAYGFYGLQTSIEKGDDGVMHYFAYALVGDCCD